MTGKNVKKDTMLEELDDKRLEFLNKCVLNSIPIMKNLIEELEQKKIGTNIEKPRTKKRKKKESSENVEATKGKKIFKSRQIIGSDDSSDDEIIQKTVEIPINSKTLEDEKKLKLKKKRSKSSLDDLSEEEILKKKKKEEDIKEEIIKKRTKELAEKKEKESKLNGRTVNEKRREKEKKELNKKKENEATKRRKPKEEREEEIDSDNDGRHPNIIIESATDSEKEEEEEIKPSTSRKNFVSVDEKNKSTKKFKNVSNMDRKEVLLKFGCITAPELEIKQIDDFLAIREMLKEYGIPEEYKKEFALFPESEFLTCDSDACPFLLKYEKPFSQLYQDARKKWTPAINRLPNGAHLKNKCVKCAKYLSKASVETWNILGASSFYCSLKCLADKVRQTNQSNEGTEKITVQNLSTGEIVKDGIYQRELQSFFLLSPHWTTQTASKSTCVEVKKDKEISKKVQKKTPEQIEALRLSVRKQFEKALYERSKQLNILITSRSIEVMVEKIEEKLYEKCNQNLLTNPNYRVWQHQFLKNIEQEKTKQFVINILTNRLSIEKLVSLDATQLRDSSMLKPSSTSSASTSRKPIRHGVSPLDAIIGDDERDTTSEHMSHAFSKTCQICQKKQRDDAQIKIKIEQEEIELRGRREQTKLMMAEVKLQELKMKRRQMEEDHNKNESKIKEEDDDYNYYTDYNDYEAGTSSQGFDNVDYSSVEKNRISLKPLMSKTNDESLRIWRCSLNIYLGGPCLKVEAVPIFSKTSENYELMEKFRRVVNYQSFNICSTVRVQDFLMDSHRAMNEHQSCAISVFRVEALDMSLCREILEYNLKNELVLQLKLKGDDEFLSIFLFPHTGSEILHDTLAPITYNIETTEMCFLLVFILQPNFAEKFRYSVRLSDAKMREQLEEIERLKSVKATVLKVKSINERQQSFDYNDDETSEHIEDEQNPMFTSKVSIIVNIIQNAAHFRDILDSFKDFMMDKDVSEEDKKIVGMMVKNKMDDDKRDKKEEKLKLNLAENGVGIASLSASASTHPTPTPLPIIPEMFTHPPPTFYSTPIINMTVQPPLPSPSSRPPPPPCLPPMQLIPPFGPAPNYNTSYVHRTEREIVADAIRQGVVPPVPKELLMPNIPNERHWLKEDQRWLEKTERRIEMEKRVQCDIDERSNRRQQNQNQSTVSNQKPSIIRYQNPNLIQIKSRRMNTKTIRQYLIDEYFKRKKDNEEKCKFLLPCRFGRSPKMRTVNENPTEAKKRKKRKRGGVKIQKQKKMYAPPPPPPPPPLPPQLTQSSLHSSQQVLSTPSTLSMICDAEMILLPPPPPPPPLEKKEIEDDEKEPGEYHLPPGHQNELNGFAPPHFNFRHVPFQGMRGNSRGPPPSGWRGGGMLPPPLIRERKPIMRGDPNRGGRGALQQPFEMIRGSPRGMRRGPRFYEESPRERGMLEPSEQEGRGNWSMRREGKGGRGEGYL